MADLSNPGRAFRSRMNANTITADAIVVRNQAQIGGVTAATTADTSRVANASHPLTTVDSAPNTNNANHLVTSKGVADAIDTAINDLVASAPGTLDTLNEIAAAIGDDANFNNTVTNAIATKHPVINTSARLNANLVGGGAVDNTEFGYVSGVTSAIQAQLDGKEPALAANQRIDWSASGAEVIDSSRYTTGASDVNGLSDGKVVSGTSYLIGSNNTVLTGANNSCYGNDAGKNLSTGQGNIMVGDQAGVNTWSDQCDPSTARWEGAGAGSESKNRLVCEWGGGHRFVALHDRCE